MAIGAQLLFGLFSFGYMDKRWSSFRDVGAQRVEAELCGAHMICGLKLDYNMPMVKSIDADLRVLTLGRGYANLGYILLCQAIMSRARYLLESFVPPGK